MTLPRDFAQDPGLEVSTSNPGLQASSGQNFTTYPEVVPSCDKQVLTPASTTSTAERNIYPSFSNFAINVPAYDRAILVREYPTEIEPANNDSSPRLRDSQGVFTYGVGVELKPALLTAATTAIPPVGITRRHTKPDFTGFTYLGRSRGAGSSVGIEDTLIQSAPHIKWYKYQELGFNPEVSCIYNQTTNFKFQFLEGDWWATGTFPDSDQVDSSWYPASFGNSTDNLVAIGVTHDENSPRRYMTFAAGRNYAFLDKVQCAVDWFHAEYEVTVNLEDRTIIADRVGNLNFSLQSTDLGPIKLTRTLMRQFAFLTNDQVTLYRSTVGDAFSTSVGIYEDIPKGGTQDANSTEETLQAVERIVQSMADEMLVAYGSAQLKLANEFIETGVTAQITGIKIGGKAYIYAVLVMNAIILLAVIVEAIRTNIWRDMPGFDHTDPKTLVVAGSVGGMGVGLVAKDLEQFRYDYAEKLGKVTVYVDSDGSAIRLADEAQGSRFDTKRWHEE
ncbi:hypothetical protein ABW19_dt0200022 [Dactylella cylindrospora]|nr:hypothetical protein ABW19_dt0200022 [Dactylella cylindrospora]